MMELAEKMHQLFDEDESIKEWIILGKLPSDIAEIAAEALDGKHGKKQMPISLMTAPEPYMYVAHLIQKEFFPESPGLEKGGFMKMLTGRGPAPDWVVVGQVSDQIVARAKAHGYEVESRQDIAENEAEDDLDI